MSRIIDNDLVLTKEETNSLLTSLNCPNMDAIKKREKLLSSLNSFHIEERNKTTVILDVPDLILPNLTQKIYSSEKITFKNYLLQTAEHISIEVNYYENLQTFGLIDFDSKKDYNCLKNSETMYTVPFSPNSSDFAA